MISMSIIGTACLKREPALLAAKYGLGSAATALYTVFHDQLDGDLCVF